jgi:hypothetical protein
MICALVRPSIGSATQHRLFKVQHQEENYDGEERRNEDDDADLLLKNHNIN